MCRAAVSFPMPDAYQILLRAVLSVVVLFVLWSPSSTQKGVINVELRLLSRMWSILCVCPSQMLLPLLSWVLIVLDYYQSRLSITIINHMTCDRDECHC